MLSLALGVDLETGIQSDLPHPKSPHVWLSQVLIQNRAQGRLTPTEAARTARVSKRSCSGRMRLVGPGRHLGNGKLQKSSCGKQ